MINQDFALRGFRKCPRCEKMFTASFAKGRNGKHPYYRCNNPTCDTKSIALDDVEEDLKKTLSRASPRPEVLKLFKAVVKDVWGERMANVETNRLQAETEIAVLEKEKDKAVEEFVNVKSETLKRALEEKVDKMEIEIKAKSENLKSPTHTAQDFGTALNQMEAFVKNPLNEWEKGDIQKRRLVTRMVFINPITYNHKKRDWNRS